MIFSTVDDFYLDSHTLLHSPSVKDDIAPSTERTLRRYGCELICAASRRLQLPQAVACTAQVLLHRFYCKESLKVYDVNVVSVAMFWLACKLEEVLDVDDPTAIRLRDVLSVFYYVTKKIRYGMREGGVLDIASEFYANLKAEVVKTEHHALRCFGFITHVEHAHPFTLMLGAQLGLHKDVLQYACNIINDSLRTTLCVQYKAEHIASAAIFLAARKYGCGLPETWWKACRVESEDLAHVCKTILELYTNEGGAESYTYIKLQSHFLDFTKGQIPDTSNSRGDTLKMEQTSPKGSARKDIDKHSRKGPDKHSRKDPDNSSRKDIDRKFNISNEVQQSHHHSSSRKRSNGGREPTRDRSRQRR